MLLLPAVVTATQARDTLRLLIQGIPRDADASVVVDATNLDQFDSSVLAVLLACQRAARGCGKPFELRAVPPKLAALAKLYGVDALLMPEPEASGTPAGPG